MCCNQILHVFQKVAREGVEPSFPPYQSSVLNRWTTKLSMLLNCKTVGMTGLEPAVSWSQTRRDSQLRYIPIFKCLPACRCKPALIQYPVKESNPVYNVRSVACIHHTHRASLCNRLREALLCVSGCCISIIIDANRIRTGVHGVKTHVSFL